MKKIALVFVCGIFIQCIYFQKRTTFTVENKSDLFLDSVVFKVNNVTFSIKNISPSSEARQTIKTDSVRTNNHDVMITASVYSKGKLVKGGFYYNDLSGSLNPTYVLVLKADLTTTLK
ncbi:MAG: hypothetical protein JSU09_06565 [Bacteroidetes bacterium]|nr:hypothetical protein [Bacteroidota bacterium]